MSKRANRQNRREQPELPDDWKRQIARDIAGDVAASFAVSHDPFVIATDVLQAMAGTLQEEDLAGREFPLQTPEGAQVGTLKDFRVEGDKLVADMHLDGQTDAVRVVQPDVDPRMVELTPAEEGVNFVRTESGLQLDVDVPCPCAICSTPIDLTPEAGNFDRCRITSQDDKLFVICPTCTRKVDSRIDDQAQMN